MKDRGNNIICDIKDLVGASESYYCKQFQNSAKFFKY